MNFGKLTVLRTAAPEAPISEGAVISGIDKGELYTGRKAWANLWQGTPMFMHERLKLNSKREENDVMINVSSRLASK